ncbi:MAG: radical SAM protein [Bacteroidales bacterium]|nr:radical SAM protein [Bacteroidales bacterium]
MSTFLWESIAFGPIHSRRLGSSLGINLLPTDVKICSFNCIYCECGWTLEKSLTAREYYPVETVMQAIEHKLQEALAEGKAVDSITFSGNGEPTLHPHFDQIIEQLLGLRDKYYPNAVISCLSNATQLLRPEVCSALKKIENPILKLDAGTQEMLNIINDPTVPVNIDEVVHELTTFEGNVIIQTMFLSGEKDGVAFDNSTEPNLSAWLAKIELIRPRKVMIYSLDREAPATKLHKFSKEKLEEIAELVRKMNITVETY